ncbi:MFS transporter [Serinicoccus kebangsaanensis]|uniref:MFS transporter n=1 Tax=Serinicoccus kebangsaanensis TaxID=2602069 RepID=UPI00124F6570|nr:MFS transporter [Serinicoccus kebangsaanensis]
MTKVMSAWSSRDYRRVWGASTAGAVGGEIGELALPVLALVTLGASAQELSWMRTATFLPYLLLTLWLGVVVDNRRRRPLMIGAEVGRAALLVAVGALALTGQLSVPILVAATFGVGALAVLHMLADFSFLPYVVSPGQLPDANARITATQSAVGIGGSGLGGALVQAVTAPVAVLVNAFTHLVSALLLRRVRVEEAAVEPAEAGTLAQAKEGLVTMLRHRVVRALAAEATVWNLGNEVFMLALTVAVVGGRSDGPLVLGLVLMAGGVGAFVGASLSARLTARVGYGRSLVGAMLLGNTAPLLGVVLSGSTSLRSLIVLGVAFLASGVGIGVANSQAVTVRQLAVPERLRGRVNSAYRLLSWGALSVGAMLAGVLVTLWGPWATAVVGTALMTLATLPVALSPVRHMRDLDDDPEPAAAPAE